MRCRVRRSTCTAATSSRRSATRSAPRSGGRKDALAAALDAQRALAAEDFSAVEGVRVRMALHTGTADERDGDYFGPAVIAWRGCSLSVTAVKCSSPALPPICSKVMPPQTSLRRSAHRGRRDFAGVSRRARSGDQPQRLEYLGRTSQ